MAEAKHEQQFTEILDGLNPAQRMAVDQIEGPVLVVAGPGTGKTHILAARIGKILRETDANPNNILCLTFTDAGVVAMRERLLKFIGPTAHRIHIFTFHSFCNKIIQDNLSLFGRHYLEPLDDLERIEIVREVLHDLPADHLMRRMAVGSYVYEQHLQDLFQHMKSEGWDEKMMLERIDAYIESLPERPEYQYKVNRGDMVKGALKTAKFEEAELRMNRLRAAIPLYQKYQEALERRGRYDFEDMILWVLDAFRKYPALLRTYQEQYLYLLVDEYQDTNGAQNSVLRALIEYWENPNVFIVGDDDQSIYEFQGARLKNLTDFYEAYAGHLKTIVLQENYRSTPAVLDAAGALIRNNEKRLITALSELGLEKKLKASGAFAESKVQPEITEYQNHLQEVAHIVASIEKAQSSGVPLEEIAVIYAKHRQGELLRDLLRRKAIPFQTKRRPNALDAPVIQRVRMLLEYLSMERSRPGSGDLQLYRLLHFKHWKISPKDLGILSLARNKDPKAGEQGLRNWLGQEKVLNALSLEAPDRIRFALDCLDRCLLELDHLPLLRFLEFLLNESGLLAFVFSEPERDSELGNIQALQDFIRRQAAKNPRIDLDDALDLLKRMDHNNLALPQREVLPAGPGVNLMTAHASKGLEFQEVYILDCVKDSWEPRRQGGQYRFSFPDTLTFSGEEDALEARRRLFYVAVTRAKERLHISWPRYNQKGKEQQPPVFLDELAEGGCVVQSSLANQPSEAEENEVREARDLLMQKAEVSADPVYDAARINELLKDFSLSVSGMNAYLRCPLSFFYEQVLRVPRLQSEAASFGTAMHNSLQWLFERMLGHKKREFPPVEELVGHFKGEMEKLRAWFEPVHFKQRLEMGEKYLRKHYFRGLKKWWRKVRVEMEIRQAEYHGVPIQGVIDKVEYLADNEVRLVDYKTGRYDLRKTRPMSNRNAQGGTYWRQLLFYKILFENHRVLGPVATKGVIAYLEPDEQGDFHEVEVDLSTAAADQLGSLLQQVYAGIQAHEFDGCRKPECSWCAFEKNHVHPDLRIAPPEEELDDKS
ncbi:MAG: ATP-dependent helicase [Bacteroidetes bacterium]|nr:ATP-dependent helicase [Bacteroidota bacterium]